MRNMRRELIDQLDPHRDYGDRSFEEVVAGVQQCRLRLEPGQGRLPVIRDLSTGLPANGGGQPPLPDGTDLTRWGRKRFNERAVDDFDAVYDSLIEACTDKHDPRAFKLFLETFLGRPQEGLRDDGGAIKALIGLLTDRSTRRVEYIDAETGESLE